MGLPLLFRKEQTKEEFSEAYSYVKDLAEVAEDLSEWEKKINNSFRSAVIHTLHDAGNLLTKNYLGKRGVDPEKMKEGIKDEIQGIERLEQHMEYLENLTKETLEDIRTAGSSKEKEARKDHIEKIKKILLKAIKTLKDSADLVDKAQRISQEISLIYTGINRAKQFFQKKARKPGLKPTNEDLEALDRVEKFIASFKEKTGKMLRQEAHISKRIEKTRSLLKTALKDDETEMNLLEGDIIRLRQTKVEAASVSKAWRIYKSIRDWLKYSELRLTQLERMIETFKELFRHEKIETKRTSKRLKKVSGRLRKAGTRNIKRA